MQEKRRIVNVAGWNFVSLQALPRHSCLLLPPSACQRHAFVVRIIDSNLSYPILPLPLELCALPLKASPTYCRLLVTQAANVIA